jgi:hypothetical protein
MGKLPFLLLPLLAVSALAQCPPCPCLSNTLLSTIARGGISSGELAQQRAALRQTQAQTDLLRAQAKNLNAQRSTMERENAAAQRAMREQKNASEAQARLVAAFRSRIALARQKHQDFDAVANRPDVTLTPAMQQAVIESDSGGELVYYFGQHPEEAIRIAVLSPVSSILEIGKIAGRLSPAN